MKFEVEQRDLKAILGRVVSAVENRTTIPILSNLLLEVSGGVLNVTGTDLDIRHTERLALSNASDGACTVNAQLLKAIIDKLKPEKLIQFDLGDYLNIKSGVSKFKLAILPAEDFPSMANDEYDSVIEFDGLELKNAIDRTIWAVSTEETRYYLNGIAMQHREGAAMFISTDGHRLSRYKSEECPEFENIIIPNKTAKQFRSVLESGNVTVSISRNKIKVETDTLTITSKVIDGTFPDWTRIVPSDRSSKFTALSSEVKAAIERVVVVATERTKAVRLSIEDGGVTFDVRDTGMGTATERVDVTQDGANLEIGLNSKYALDAMAQADKGNVTVFYTDNNSPILVEYENEPSLFCVTMPIRI